MYNVVDVTDQMVANGSAPNVVAAQVLEIAEAFRDNTTIYDNGFFIIWIMFVVSTFYMSYKADKENYFSAFGFLFFIGMLFLLVLSIFTTFSDWWTTQILEKMLPSIMTLLPKYGWYLEHIGLISFIQLTICVVLNLVDFDLAGIFNRKKKEQSALEQAETEDVL
jgi:hypothetical protein